jgi:hypothetical protein
VRTIEVREVVTFPISRTVFKVTSQGEFNTRKRHFRPRDVIWLDQFDLEAFRAGGEERFRQVSPKHDMHLMRVDDVHDREETPTSTEAPASSKHSRAAPRASVSPFSMNPAGMVQ